MFTSVERNTSGWGARHLSLAASSATNESVPCLWRHRLSHQSEDPYCHDIYCSMLLLYALLSLTFRSLSVLPVTIFETWPKYIGAYFIIGNRLCYHHCDINQSEVSIVVDMGSDHHHQFTFCVHHCYSRGIVSTNHVRSWLLFYTVPYSMSSL